MRQARYTLIELLISMGIFAMMMLLLLNFFSKYQDFVYRAGLRNDRVADT
jgi:type II secretory pathway pseudopilin PulG